MGFLFVGPLRCVGLLLSMSRPPHFHVSTKTTQCHASMLWIQIPDAHSYFPHTPPIHKPVQSRTRKGQYHETTTTTMVVDLSSRILCQSWLRDQSRQCSKLARPGEKNCASHTFVQFSPPSVSATPSLLSQPSWPAGSCSQRGVRRSRSRARRLNMKNPKNPKKKRPASLMKNMTKTTPPRTRKPFSVPPRLLLARPSAPRPTCRPRSTAARLAPGTSPVPRARLSLSCPRPTTKRPLAPP
ncbi:hypothetical protein JOL62DRAFT_329525 [Phyllosticta paracitricarpa]|uniref:Secreted protein n=1 Tax=Phyllosticta paracitricarpa TaxID=2016321 RepID=A0ABR1MWS6_9PEZI